MMLWCHCQELEPGVAEQLLNLWNKSSMPAARSVAGMQAFVPGHYLPTEYATTPFNQRPRPPHPGNQYPGWPYNQWSGMMPPQRHGCPAAFPQDFSATPHLQSQFGYSLPQPRNYPGGMYHHPPSSTNPSVMILQRSAGSDSSAGK